MHDFSLCDNPPPEEVARRKVLEGLRSYLLALRTPALVSRDEGARSGWGIAICTIGKRIDEMLEDGGDNPPPEDN